MDAYLDIQILDDPEFKTVTLLNTLFSNLHRGLVQYGKQSIGISFPDFQEGIIHLGSRLRIHGCRDEIQNLMELNWIKGMQDYVSVSDIKNVPSDCKYRIIRRVQAKSNPERLRRRLIARKGIDAKAAKQAIPDSFAERLKLPYIALASHSTGQQFRLFVENLPIQEQAIHGIFSSYGLSPTATIPWF